MLIRRRTLDAIHDGAVRHGLAVAEQLVTALGPAVEAGDIDAIRLLYPIVCRTLADERDRWQPAAAGGVAGQR